MTVRLPTLSLVEAQAGPLGTRILAILLCLAAWAALRRAFARQMPEGPRLIAASVLAAGGLAPALNATYTYAHEAWIGSLLALALGLRRPERYAPAVLVGLLAVAIREIALPMLGAMAVLALGEGRRREAAT
ncbi:hypothetical protein MMB17_21795 [Methylobacterium organophilum]|uniref:hypothetical protein n=1 Tax=Methylobacterium organophilum TaxID=410 RepID=UPI001F137F44|nr:hypothetical protein [Methylobacterium organophilum]UMY17236.1 hypothetical protein MMB17_21795 [Methylobacterium organophilum]